ncbi:alpha/beta fold hydrolase [Propionicicella superfundia]|uniref:alpha/beta fold hydrolase n=1 Tax=Propionicicella superfundia TaxID=348582 RepID=UPI0004126419|nr:alpha/beta hydrolase [Propionicicella superfundia]
MKTTRAARPLLILLHGTWSSGAEMAPVGESLGAEVDVVVPDLPGHGTRRAEPYSLARSAAVVDAIVTAAGERDVVVAGHSLGGFAALTYAERNPGRMAGLALLGCATEPRGAGAAAYRAAGRAFDLFGPLRMRSMFRGERFLPVAPLWDEVIDRCGSRQLREVSCPVLLLGGRFDQLHLGARSFSRAARHATVVTRSSRSHVWPYRRPHEVAAELRLWLRTEVLPRLAVSAAR